MDGKIWTAEELDQLSPAEQDALFQAGLVRDLDDLPAGLRPLVERMRARAEARIAGRNLPNAS